MSRNDIYIKMKIVPPHLPMLVLRTSNIFKENQFLFSKWHLQPFLFSLFNRISERVEFVILKSISISNISLFYVSSNKSLANLYKMVFIKIRLQSLKKFIFDDIGCVTLALSDFCGHTFAGTLPSYLNCLRCLAKEEEFSQL